MRIGNRSLPTVLRSVFQKRNYGALLNMRRSYPAFWENLRRYLSGKGIYPYKIEIRTPTGSVSPIWTYPGSVDTSPSRSIFVLQSNLLKLSRA
jgi:hypothetical protein